MRRIKIIACIALLALLPVALFGCKGTIVSGETYYLYNYDSTTDRFVNMRTSLSFGEGLSTFEYTFAMGDLTISGNVEHTEIPDAYTIVCGEEVVSLVTERYKSHLVASEADAGTIEFFDALAKTFTPRAQYFSYNGYLFSGETVELYHEADENADSFEGVYCVDDSDDTIRLRGGSVYTKDEDGAYTVKGGYYTVARDILTLTWIDDNGNDMYKNGVLYRERYLMAKVTIPTGDALVGTSFEELLERSDFVNKINARISDYSGKTITVLTYGFFSKDSME